MLAAHALPALFAVFLWWLSTGIIVYLDGLPRATHRYSLAGATVLLVAALAGLWRTRDDTSLTGAYLAFTCGLIAWGWQELSFYTGYVTGPRRERCPADCGGLKHFGHAVGTVLHHEIAILATAGCAIAATWGGANQIGLWTFLVIWAMRQSAKLNVFFGVQNLSEEFIPPHMEFLTGFLNQKPMNLFFPVSITLGTIAAVLLVQAAVSTPDLTAAVGFTFLSTLMILAVFEHWLMVLPIPANVLWAWGLSSHAASEPEPGCANRVHPIAKHSPLAHPHLLSQTVGTPKANTMPEWRKQ